MSNLIKWGIQGIVLYKISSSAIKTVIGIGILAIVSPFIQAEIDAIYYNYCGYFFRHALCDTGNNIINALNQARTQLDSIIDIVPTNKIMPFW